MRNSDFCVDPPLEQVRFCLNDTRRGNVISTHYNSSEDSILNAKLSLFGISKYFSKIEECSRFSFYRSFNKSLCPDIDIILDIS